MHLRRGMSTSEMHARRHAATAWDTSALAARLDVGVGLPDYAGYIRASKALLVYGVEGPTPTLRMGQPEPVGDGARLILQPKGNNTGVRTLMPAEL